ncbi:DUF4189 domain-containing protein [Tabrizicola sp.]|jgi:hypothetical protein|uniref:DUF4189 domain-containing protein n=1 Tax=Tabrizicola sp. TaxID=2005166 RepID=UPI0035AE2409
MRFPSFPLALAPLALFALLPSQALAEYPCGNPGPGEVIVGQTEGGNGIASTPLCEYVGEDDGGGYGDGGGDPGGYWVDQYGTLAWGQDANGGPTYSWYVNAASRAEADNGAVAQCNASGFVDCRAATWVVNGSIAVAVDTAGTLYSDHGEDARQAKKKALRACKQQGGKQCQIEKVLDSPAAWISN